MSPQTLHALRQLIIMMTLAALGVLGANYTGFLDSTGIDGAIWGPIAGAGIAGAVRFVEGLRDANRAAEGKIIPADVAYDALLDLAQNPSVPQITESSDGVVWVDEPDAQVAPNTPDYGGPLGYRPGNQID